MSEAHFGVLVPHPSNDTLIAVDSREIESLISNGNGGCIIYLKGGRRIETFLSFEGVQQMVSDAQQRLKS